MRKASSNMLKLKLNGEIPRGLADADGRDVDVDLVSRVPRGVELVHEGCAVNVRDGREERRGGQGRDLCLARVPGLGLGV